MVGRSLCVCGRQLGWSENIPVVSYLFLLGRSKCCKSRIPSRYFITELLFPIITLGFYTIYGHYGAAAAIFSLTLLTLVSKDMLTKID
jgi:prepilin signal peptidase PulO-like enzyme (type II secretory pathway)